MVPKIALAAALVLAAALPAPAGAEPPPGHPTVDRAREVLGLAPGQPRTHAGRVVEAMDSNAYVYVRVRTDQGDRWLAAPRAAIPAGAAVRWSDGTELRDFYSKKLKRLFEVITFVDGLDIE